MTITNASYHFKPILREESHAVVVNIKQLSDMDVDKHEDKDANKESSVIGPEEETIGDNISEASSNATHGSNDSDSTKKNPEEEIVGDNISEASSNATHGSSATHGSNDSDSIDDSTEISQESKKKEDNNGLGRKVGLTKSKKNLDQVNNALDFLCDFVQTTGIDDSRLAIITPYKTNVKLIARRRKNDQYTPWPTCA
ncbi:hypothetical protein V8C35DRAFT_329562 [Trichoderma chlorosporum]